MKEDYSHNVKLLIDEHKNLYQYFLLHVKEYRSQFTYLTLYLSFCLGIISFVHKESVTQLPARMVDMMLLSSFLVVCYLVANILDILYSLYLIEARISVIEILVNEDVKADILTWQHKTIDNLHRIQTFRIARIMIAPNVLLGIIMCLVFIALACLHCALQVNILEGHHNKEFISLIAFVTLFLISQIISLHAKGINNIRVKVFRDNGLDYFKVKDRLSKNPVVSILKNK
jgi:hypothetical protein